MNVGELVVKFAADVQNFTAGAQQVNDSVQRTADAAQTHIAGRFVASMQGGISSLLEFGAHAYQTFLGLQGAFSLVTSALGGLFSSSANLEQLTVAFTGLTGSTQTATNTLDMLRDLAAKTPFEFDQLTSAAQRLLGAGVKLGDLNPILTAVGDAIAGTGGGAQQIDQVTLALSQIATAGTLHLQDLQQIAGAGIPVFTILAQQLGVTTDQLTNMISTGAIPAQQAIDALTKGFEADYAGQAASQGETFNGILSTIHDYAQMALQAFAGPLFDRAKQGLEVLGNLVESPGFKDFAATVGQGIATAFDTVGNLLSSTVVPGIQQLAGWLSQANGPLTALRTDFLGLVDGVTKGEGPLGNLHVLALEVGDVLSGLWQTISTNLKPAFDSIWGSIQQVAGIFSNLTTQAGSANSILSQIGSGLGQAFQTAQPILASLTQTFSTLVQDLSTGAISSAQKSFADWSPVIANVAAWFQNSLLPAFQQAEPEILNLVNIIVSQGIPAFFSIRDTISHVASVFATTLLPVIERVLPIVVQLGGFIANLLGQAMTFLIPKITQAASAIGDFASGIATRLQPFIDKLASGIQIAAGIIQVVWGYLWPWVSSLLKTAIDLIINLVTPLWDTLKFLFNAGADILSGNWKQLWSDVKGFFTSITSDLKNIGIGFWNDLKGIFNSLKSDVEDIWNKVWGGLAGPAQSAWDGVKSLIRDGINGAIDLINDMISAADKVPGVNIGKIPHVNFASGGTMAQTGMAMVGERGPELMLLPGGARIFNNDFVQQLGDLANTLSGGSAGSSPSIQAAGYPQAQQGGGIASYPSVGTSTSAAEVHIHNHIYLDGRQITEQMGPHFVAALRTAGVRV